MVIDHRPQTTDDRPPFLIDLYFLWSVVCLQLKLMKAFPFLLKFLILRPQNHNDHVIVQFRQFHYIGLIKSHSLSKGMNMPSKSSKASEKISTASNELLQNDEKSIERAFVAHLEYSIGKDELHASKLDFYKSLAYMVRDRLAERFIATQKTYDEKDPKRIYYLSLEFLMGRTLGNSILNLGINNQTEKALEELGLSFEDIREVEFDAGLGNGGLGRLAACFLDSMATLQLPAYGYGIRYEYGIFYQKIVDGYQVETPDNWLRYGNPWEFERPEDIYPIHFYGHSKTYTDAAGNIRYNWADTEEIVAMAYDTPIPGYQNNTVNNLRLWAAKSSREFIFEEFNAGDYEKAVANKNQSEVISKVLYPNDTRYTGKELRLKQQYFFVSATIQDAIKRFKKGHPDDLKFKQFTSKVAFQLNDTHPSIAIPELMRILMDDEQLSWEEAWDITVGSFGYTNHTVLPEALEKWPVSLIELVLPRHIHIIFEINRRFLEVIKSKFPDDIFKLKRMSIIEEGPEKMVRMSNLSIVGSHSVNGVAALHTQILINEVFRDFTELWPDKFNNKTNGITQRRFLLKCNPDLSALISEKIGDGWITDLYQLKKLEKFAKDEAFQKSWKKIKHNNKVAFADYLHKVHGISVNPDSMFDFQVKRMHEYKRQLLNAMYVITLYNRIKANPSGKFTPRTVFIGGKAAPGYFMAKSIIKLIGSISEVINNDKEIGDLLKVHFLPNYSVSLAQKLLPSSDLSQQISTAGMEASGTGNMKFALNGALTIGTLDGANIEIMEEVGKDNIFIFGLTSEEVNSLKKNYDPKKYYFENTELKKVIDMIASGFFSPNEPELFAPITHHLMNDGDRFMLMADYEDYVRCQEEVNKTYRDQKKWVEMSIMNVANMGKFSSDRTIREYADDIWNVKPVPVKL